MLLAGMVSVIAPVPLPDVVPLVELGSHCTLTAGALPLAGRLTTDVYDDVLPHVAPPATPTLLYASRYFVATPIAPSAAYALLRSGSIELFDARRLAFAYVNAADAMIPTTRIMTRAMISAVPRSPRFRCALRCGRRTGTSMGSGTQMAGAPCPRR